MYFTVFLADEQSFNGPAGSGWKACFRRDITPFKRSTAVLPLLKTHNIFRPAEWLPSRFKTLYIENTMDSHLKRPVPIVWQFVVLAASLGVLSTLTFSLFVPFPPEIQRILNVVDFLICLIFLADFGILLYLHKNRKKYMLTWGWLDLVSSIPMIDPLRWGRLARLIRLVRLFRGVRGSTGLLRQLFLKKQEATLVGIVLLLGCVIAFSSVGILIAEQDSGGSINTAEKAIWFTVSTFTTVGYGDLTPITTFGRAVAALTMLAGISIFGAFTALMATFLVSAPQHQENAAILEELASQRKLLIALEERLRDREQESATSDRQKM